MTSGPSRGSRYADAGVDYDALDAAKRRAVQAARSTSSLAAARDAEILDASRGESALVLAIAGQRLSFVVEGLGTKSLIAVAYEEAGGEGRFADIAYDAVAAIVNDLICVGALPVVINAYFATGDAAWYGRGTRLRELVEGWERACRDAGAVWGGGESPSLPGLVDPAGLELAGAAIGAFPAGVEPILGQDMAAGDEIVIIASSGLHANGASLARQHAAALPDGLLTPMPSGASFGDGLLTPTFLYADAIAALLAAGTGITYMSHVTGHGLRKLMRADTDLTYAIHALPDVPEVLRFLADGLSMGDAEAYGTFNMGAGLAVWVKAGQGQKAVSQIEALGHTALVAGVTRQGPRRVVLEPVGVVFEGEELALR